MWQEKLLSFVLICYSSYFLYFREAYFMKPDKIWIQEITKEYDRKIK